MDHENRITKLENEMKAMQNLIRDIQRESASMVRLLGELKENVEPIAQFFQNITWGRKTIFGTLKVVAIILGIATSVIMIYRNWR